MALPKANRLQRRQDFSKVYQQGARSRSRYLTVRALNRSTCQITASQQSLNTSELSLDQPTRVGIAVSQKVSKRAVIRNRIKRQLRAVMAQLLPCFPVGWDLVIVVHPLAVECDYDEFLRELKELLLDAEVLNGHSRGCLL